VVGCHRESMGLGLSLVTWAQGLLTAVKRSSFHLAQIKSRGGSYHEYSGAALRTPLQEAQPGIRTSGKSPPLSGPLGSLFPQLLRYLPHSPPHRRRLPLPGLLSAPPRFICPGLWLTLAMIPDLTRSAPHRSVT